MGTGEPSVRTRSGAIKCYIHFTKVALYIGECQRVLQKTGLVFKVRSFTRAGLF